jgi:hypothetical protein
MSSSKLLVWSIPAALVVLMALVEGGAQSRARAARRAPASCAARELAMDVDGDGTAERVQLERVDDDAWADVWSGTSLRSSTRVGGWRDDATLEALDVNGDGKLDLVRRWHEGGEAHAQVWLSDGNAFDEGWSGVTASCIAQR